MSSDDPDPQQQNDLAGDVSAARPVQAYCIRRRSATKVAGMPLYDIALGPDIGRGEMRGHARGIVAVGDIATGVLAMGGVARGVIAIGGVAFGVLACGGVTVGLLAAVGGVAMGVVALGGVALGAVAVGGAACGYYVCGGVAVGEHVIAATVRDPQAVQFFAQWCPFQLNP